MKNGSEVGVCFLNESQQGGIAWMNVVFREISLNLIHMGGLSFDYNITLIKGGLVILNETETRSLQETRHYFSN